MSALYLLQARVELVKMARPSGAYCRVHGLDWSVMEAVCGGVYMAPIRTDGAFFDFDRAGAEAVVIEARAANAWTVIDLVAWFPATPEQWFIAAGGAPALGLAAAANPSTYIAGLPLQLYATPEQWLASGCFGAVLLDVESGAEWLDTVHLTGTVAVQSDAHAREIDTARRQLGLRRRHQFVVPADARVAA